MSHKTRIMPAHKLEDGDIIKIGETKVSIRSVSPGYCDHTKLSLICNPIKDDTVLALSVLVPRHFKFKVYTKK